MQHQAANDLVKCAACLEQSEPRYREAARLYRAVGNHTGDANAGEQCLLVIRIGQISVEKWNRTEMVTLILASALFLLG